MARFKKFGSSNADHLFAAKEEIRTIRRQADKATDAYEKDDCLKAGKVIDAAYRSMGRAETHLYSMSRLDPDAHSDLLGAGDDVHFIDEKFEKTCVRKRPGKVES